MSTKREPSEIEQKLAEEAVNERITRGVRALRIHRVLTVCCYVVAGIAAFVVLGLPGASTNTVALLASAAIIATFGGAIAASGSMFERDALDRIALDLDILNRDLAPSEYPWRRWPWIKRRVHRRLLTRDEFMAHLAAPVVPVDYGSHVAEYEVPTSPPDFFDLSVLSNLLGLLRGRSAFLTAYMRRVEARGSDAAWKRAGAERHSPDEQEYGIHECIKDIWVWVFIFRVARYAVHFGTALVFGSIAALLAYL
jgi:hypothetical protein